MKKSLPVILALIPFALSKVFSGDASLGAVVSATLSPYKSYKAKILPLPFILYDGERFFSKGTSVGVHILKNDRHELSLGAAYLGLEFKPGRTDEKPLKALSKRRSTVMGELSYSYVGKIGLVRAQLARDALGHSDGFMAALSLHVPWMTEKFIVMPGLGLQWADSRHMGYYYGVSGKEAARSGLTRYVPGDSVSPFLMLEAKVAIVGRWDAVLKGKIERLSGEATGSPMVGKRFAASVMAGVQRSF